MNKAEFIEKLSKELDTTKTAASKSFDAVIKESNSSIVTKQLLNILSLQFFPNHYPTYYSTLKL